MPYQGYRTEDNPAQFLNQIDTIQSPDFLNKTRQELFYQYQIANTLAEEEQGNPVDLSYIMKDIVKENDYHTTIFHGAGK